MATSQLYIWRAASSNFTSYVILGYVQIFLWLWFLWTYPFKYILSNTFFQTKSWILLPVWPWGSSPLLLSGPTMFLQVNSFHTEAEYISLCLNNFRILQLEELSEVVQCWQRPEGPPEGRYEGRDRVQRLPRPHHRRGNHLGLHRLQPGLPPEVEHLEKTLWTFSPIC